MKEATTDRFGTTTLGDRPIWRDLKRVMGNTAQLIIPAELVAILLGVLSAVRQYSLFDYPGTCACRKFGFAPGASLISGPRSA